MQSSKKENKTLKCESLQMILLPFFQSHIYKKLNKKRTTYKSKVNFIFDSKSPIKIIEKFLINDS